MKKILLISDAAEPQVNGVVTTLKNTVAQAYKHGDRIHVFTSEYNDFKFKLPFYSEIELSIPKSSRIRDWLTCGEYDHVHIMTLEGPIGIMASNICRQMKIPFTASMHTKFPEFVNARFPVINPKYVWKGMKWLYRDAKAIFVPTDSFKNELVTYGFDENRLKIWGRGVNTEYFYPRETKLEEDQTILLCVSRVSQEKGLDDFCSLDIPNSRKILVGDGPYRKELEKKYPDVIFVGMKDQSELGEYYRSADVFVFPSKADTFGVVMIEAMACGLPIAAYPVPGPIDVVKNQINGALDKDLSNAVSKALRVDRESVITESKQYTWENSYKQFRNYLV